MFRKRKFVLILSGGVVVFVLLTFLFFNILTKWESHRYDYVKNDIVPKRILDIYRNLPVVYYEKFQEDENSTSKMFLKNIRINKNVNLTNLWKYVNDFVSKDSLYPQNEYLGSLVHAMETSKIINATLDQRGTQLKFLLTLDGGQKVIFKPKWYKIDKIIEGSVYAGKDRFGSEIVAFYLSAILNKPLVPVSVIRSINLRNEILPVGSKELISTSFHYKNLTCIYGKCYYCKKEDPICSNSSGFLTGAVIFNLNIELKNHRSPWQRTYKANKKALWETKENYCRSIKSKLPLSRLYDLIDTAIFDFLIQNGDRHHYETFQDKVLYLDNGKGLGNPNVHHIDILAPLYQCCMIRKSTWNILLQLRNGKLKEKLMLMPNIKYIITDNHINAIDARLLLIYAVVEYCKNHKSEDTFV